MMAWLASRGYALKANPATDILTVAPLERDLEDGTRMPGRLAVLIERDEFERAYPTPLHGGQQQHHWQ